jgi:hypothetical protein
MPESKHRRSGKNRPRAYQKVEPERRPAPSPPWVPITGVSLLVAGVAVILIGYLPGVSEALDQLPLLGANWGLVGGFVLLCIGFGFLTRWR